MVGITSYGAYIPFFRLSGDTIAKAWGRRSAGGERSVANHDEDSVTMATEAVLNTLKGIERRQVDGLFFASTTSPYKEKQCSTMVAAAADLPSEILSSDFANSLRAGTSALRAARDAVSSGSAKNFLVTAADCRIGFPQSEQEQNFGDAAAAVLVGDTGVIATIEDSYSICDEITDVWRTDKETFVHSWEDRWVLTYGYAKNMERAISEIMKRHSLSPKDFAKAVLNAPNERSQRDLAQRLGFDPKTQLQSALFGTVGNSGAAHPLLMLAMALEEAKAGDKIILASYGQGADAFILKVTDQIEKRGTRDRVKGYIASKTMLTSYARYLAHRQLIQLPPEVFNLDSAATTTWRTRDWVYGLHGSKCKRCGMVAFPIQRVCYGCQVKDEFEEVRLSDKRGKVFTFSLDNLAGGPDTPLVQTIVESDEGAARIYCLMTDCDPNEVKVNMPVEMTFRRFREARGFYDYFWKCRPLR
jgi:hydroxymethylglutaryl-CoA synthase